MAIATADTAELAKLIEPDTLAARGFPKPKRVSVVLSTDHTGEDAYFVYLLFPDDTPDLDLSWDRVKEMVRWVQERVWKAADYKLWPYVRVKREFQVPGAAC